MNYVASTSTSYYLSAATSSLGSLTYVLCLPAFVLNRGGTLAEVGITLAIGRLGTAAAGTLFGQTTDRFTPKRFVVVTELVCATLTCILIHLWHAASIDWYLFAVVTGLRSGVVALQTNARAKIAHLYGKANEEGHWIHAVLFNLSTQGTAILAGLLAYPLVSTSFTVVALVDAGSFLFSGALLLGLHVPDTARTQTVVPAARIRDKFESFYRGNSRVALADLALAVAMTGTTAFMARLAGSTAAGVPLFGALYGLAAWIAGALVQHQGIRKHEALAWWVLALAALLASAFSASSSAQWPVIAMAALMYLSYWTLFHRHTVYLHKTFDSQQIASVTAARLTQMTLVLGAGEAIVGMLSTTTSVLAEGIWRSCLAASVALALWRFPAREPQVRGT